MVVLGVLVLVYQIGYLTFGTVPGNSPDYPLGWWGWNDQGLYLKSSLAMARGDFSPDQHFYLPLYPFLGALLVGIAPQHPYWLPDLLLMLGFAALFQAFAARYIGPWLAVVALLAGMVLFQALRLQWLVPWTSTLSAFLMMAALYLLDRYLAHRNDSKRKLYQSVANAALFGLALGALVATRAIDLVVMSPLALTYAALVVRDLVWAPGRRWQAVLLGVAGVAGFLVPVGGWLAFNQIAYGAYLGGPYFAAAGSFGFFLSTLPIKLYSHLLDSRSVYGEAGQDWAHRLLPITLSLAFVPALFIARVPAIFRVAAAAVIVQFCVYYAYSDIVPTGTFRFNNIHYFKWMMPLLPAMAITVVASVFSKDMAGRWRGAVGLISAAVIVGGAASVATDHRPLGVSVLAEDDTRAVIELPEGRLDYIDLPGTTGDWMAMYFSRGFSVLLDGEPLVMPRDYHTYPVAGGMRLMFVRPISGKQIVVDLGDSKVRFDTPLRGVAQGWAISLKLGARQSVSGVPVRLGERLDAAGEL